MDDNQKQSLGGVKNNDNLGATPNNSVDGFAAARPTAPVSNNMDNKSNLPANEVQNPSSVLFSSSEGSSPSQSPAHQPVSVNDEKLLANTPEAEAIKLKANNKALKVWLVVFIVVFVAAVAGLIVYFVLHGQSQANLNDSQQKNAALQKQIDDNALSAEKQQTGSTQTQLTQIQTQLTAAQAQVKTLTTQNTTATANITTLQTYITSLTATATQLKTTCGTACAAIAIPVAPTLAK